MSTEGFREFVDRGGFPTPEPDVKEYSDIEVVNLYQQNPAVRVTELAALTGRTIPEFYRVLKRYGVEPSRLKTNQHLVTSYASQGYAVSEIATLTGYTTRNVRYILSKSKLNG